MHEVMFQGQKSFPLKSPLTGSVNVDISFIEHSTGKNNQCIEIICLNVDTSKEMRRIYVFSKTINDMINLEEHDKHPVRNSTEKSNSEHTPLSSAALKSLTIQKLLDLLIFNSANPNAFVMELLPFNTTQLSISIPEDVVPHEVILKYVPYSAFVTFYFIIINITVAEQNKMIVFLALELILKDDCFISNLLSLYLHYC
jgi:hypothetical protein